MSNYDRVKAMSDELKALKEKLHKEFQDNVSGIFREFFESVPLVENIVWTQYTPYFNDGEPCEFAVHTPEFYYKGTTENDGPEGSYSWGDSGTILLPGEWLQEKYNHPKIYFAGDSETYEEAAQGEKTDALQEYYEPIRAMEDFIQSRDNMEFFQAVFGDHCKVTASIEGVDIEEYEHD